jgi:hypothetical protein
MGERGPRRPRLAVVELPVAAVLGCSGGRSGGTAPYTGRLVAKSGPTTVKIIEGKQWRGAASPSTQGERMAAVELLWWGKNENDGGAQLL